MTAEQAIERLRAALGVAATGEDPRRPLDRRHLVVTVPVDRWVEALGVVRDGLGCRYFCHLTAVDWKAEGFEVVCRVENLETELGITVKTRIDRDTPVCPTLTGLYRGALWMERECYDLFGIRFEGHPDLRRLLLPDDWEGHPLRKDFAVDTPHPPYR
ncbi:MAG TPA: NADH-quinone oxidoreductase subunit C [Methylomirabilota bacterium]|nr:NADH-quinone oxidoreductase subunit C [Methylomirabilota bacterium]